MSKLCILAEKYFVDKCPKYNHYYTPEYDKLLNNKCSEYKKVLEIGIGYPELMIKFTNKNYISGASLYMWREYFTNAIIYGADIKSFDLVDNKNIKTYVCDQSCSISLLNMMDNIGDMDLIIDDGSHILEHQILTFKILWRYCKDKYIIEDVSPQNMMLLYSMEKFYDDCKCILSYKHVADNQGFLVFQKLE